MVKTNYQTFGSKGFQLRLRLYKDGETKYVNVTKLLKGNIQSKHWNQKRQYFIPSCPYSDENNEILVLFRQRYDRLAVDWDGSVAGLLLAVEEAGDDKETPLTLSLYFENLISDLKTRRHPDGSRKGTYEEYAKVHKRLSEFCQLKKIDYGKLLLSEVTPALVGRILEWVRKDRGGKGLNYISKTLRSVINMAGRDGYLDSSAFATCDWFKKKSGSSAKHHTLTQQQIDKFVSAKLEDLPHSNYTELYRDVCVFMTHTGQSICDALSLTMDNVQDIGGVPHLVFKRRKIGHKQPDPCAVPMGNEVRRIMDRWRFEAKDNYIFPVRSKKRIASDTETSNVDIKHFTSRLNMWLKDVGQWLGCKFPLHTYAFRHTAITRYMSKGVPAVYVANMMGTSVENIESIYYDNRGDRDSRNKIIDLMR